VVGFPLLIIPFAIYNMIAFITPMDWGTKLYTFRLMSGLEWSPTLSDAFIAFSLLMLMFEFIKSTRHGKSFVEHFLSLALAGGAGTEFVMVPQAANSTFVLLTAICVVDFLAGLAASLRRASARRAAAAEAAEPPVLATVTRLEPVARPEPARAEPTRAELPRAEPVREPPLPPSPPAAPAAPAAMEPEARPNPFIKVEPAAKIQ